MVKGKEKVKEAVEPSDCINVTKSEVANVNASAPIKIDWADKNIAKNVK